MAATAAKLPTSTAITTTSSGTTPSSPPSSSSSPSHEFSFTNSFHPSAPSTAPPKSLVKGSKTSSPVSSAIDLSPADDIFFHGHLLPLHFLSRPPLISPRLSNVSSSGDNLGLPNPPAATTATPTAAAATTAASIDQIPNTNSIITSTTVNSGGAAEGKEVKSRASKSSSFTSLFGRRRKELEEEDKSKKKDKEKEKEKKKKFDVSRVLKKYATMVEALLFSRGARQKRDLSRRPYSFSGNSNWKGREEWIERRRKRWGQFSAPASMRTSPTNSGLLVATTNYASSEESTMEELQNAIQAAIAHCKNSIAMKEKEKEILEKEKEEEILEKETKCS